MLPNPTILLAGVVLSLTIFTSGFVTGKRWAEGEAALEQGAALSDAAEKAKTETNRQVAVAVKDAEQRTRARMRQQKLEVEIGKDENAKSRCVSDGTLLMLNHNIGEANKAVAGDGYGYVRSDSKSAGFLRGGHGAMDWFLGGKLPGVRDKAKESFRLDQGD